MPTYEFRCPEGHEFETFYRSIAAAPPETHCPVCGKLAERLLSGGAGLVFKGSGFYITDYGKDGKKQQTSQGGGKPGSDAASKGETAKPESKPGEATGAGESKPAKPDAPAPSAKKTGGE